MENTVNFTYQGRYFTEGDRANANSVWIVLHGYGQLAQYFVRKFLPVAGKSAFVIAPEALSHFYLEDVTKRAASGNTRVGASWMTRENRLTDIQNYLTFLDSVYEQELKGNTLPVTILGFSQGAATASRWALEGKINFHRLVLWAGILPPDIDLLNGRQILQDKKTILVYGRNDPFLNDSRFAEMNSFAEQLSIKPNVIEFDGGHDIDPDALLQLI